MYDEAMGSDSRKYDNSREIKSVEEMRNFADFVLKKLVGKEGEGDTPVSSTVLALSGDLGSGKTTFSQQIADIFGVTENVTSPTFILQKKYLINHDSMVFEKLKTFSQIIHMDMYRIESERELGALGFNDLLKNPQNLMIIEWPEKVLGSIPADAIWINFEFVDETTRRVQW
jgi:tRNA threonylcarbamoyladenosine biosynthesis protein TsaE